MEVILRPIATVRDGFVRHDPGHLARELILLHAARGIRIAGTRYSRSDNYQAEEKQ